MIPDLFEEIKDSFKCETLDINDVLQLPLRQSSVANPSYARFFEDYKQYGYAGVILRRYDKLYSLKYYIKKILRR